MILGDSLPSASQHFFSMCEVSCKTFSQRSTVVVGCTPGLLPHSMYHFNKLLGLEPEKQCIVTHLGELSLLHNSKVETEESKYLKLILNVCVEGSLLVQGSMILPFLRYVLGLLKISSFIVMGVAHIFQATRVQDTLTWFACTEWELNRLKPNNLTSTESVCLYFINKIKWALKPQWVLQFSRYGKCQGRTAGSSSRRASRVCTSCTDRHRTDVLNGVSGSVYHTAMLSPKGKTCQSAFECSAKGIATVLKWIF